MKYAITFMKKNGKVKGRVGCNSKETADYIVKNWQEDEETKGLCILTDVENKKEEVFVKTKKS